MLSPANDLRQAEGQTTRQMSSFSQQPAMRSSLPDATDSHAVAYPVPGLSAGVIVTPEHDRRSSQYDSAQHPVILAGWYGDVAAQPACENS